MLGTRHGNVVMSRAVLEQLHWHSSNSAFLEQIANKSIYESHNEFLAFDSSKQSYSQKMHTDQSLVLMWATA